MFVPGPTSYIPNIHQFIQDACMVMNESYDALLCCHNRVQFSPILLVFRSCDIYDKEIKYTTNTPFESQHIDQYFIYGYFYFVVINMVLFIRKMVNYNCNCEISILYSNKSRSINQHKSGAIKRDFFIRDIYQ